MLFKRLSLILAIDDVVCVSQLGDESGDEADVVAAGQCHFSLPLLNNQWELSNQTNYNNYSFVNLIS